MRGPAVHGALIEMLPGGRATPSPRAPRAPRGPKVAILCEESLENLELDRVLAALEPLTA